MTTIPQWDLTQLYAEGGEGIGADIGKLKRLGEAFGQWRGRLAAITAEGFRGLVADLAALTELSERVGGYAALYFAQDTQNQKAVALSARVDECLAELGNETLFFELWWKELDEATAAALMAAAPGCAYYLAQTRAWRPHTLKEGEERIINLKDVTGRSALTDLYDAMTNRYRFKTGKIDGTGREVTRDELMVYARSGEAAQRAAAYGELYRVYGDDGPILGQIYQALARDWRLENIRLRHFRAPIDVRHKANDLEPAAVDALLAAAQRNAPLFGEFFRLKARALGLPKLRRCDLYAPLVADDSVTPFEAGSREVLEAFGAFSPRFAQLAANVLRQNRLSARPAHGKQGGAFCCSLWPGDTPWVLMTYNGRRQDLFTLAHELGHSIHSQLAADLSVFEFQATLPLAETASTFGEMLLADHIMKRTADKKARANLLFQLLDDGYATVGRQAFFALFEIKAHAMVEAGATVDELSDEYMRNLAAQFGDSVEVGPEFRWEWVSIPHIFHTPFYVYAYTFGQLLVYSLWHRYQAEGASFVPRLMALLAKGGSAAPAEILRQSGLGPLDETFWQGGFDVLAQMLGELQEALG